MSRVCCNNEPHYQVIYDGGIMGNDEILVCDIHITKHPFDKKIISKNIITCFKNEKKLE
ncbi:protein of unknown function [Nitrosotalea devaniterrae]|uniref:Uncharacterized protein n=1 Tax=Nitrosotalea devaniterrae TaxID=1078905 RepID=A0A128A1W6_9ARCH|nr:protein of unknown function [Candidatus Nitrosotalea devanaterra]